MGGGGAPAQDTYASTKQAAISREMYDYYNTNFRPLEGKLINEMNDPTLITKGVAKANGITSKALNASDASQQREAKRYGINMSPDRVTSNSRSNDLNRGLSLVGAENSTRRAVDKYKTGVLNGVAGLGRQTAGQAVSGFTNLAGQEASRNTANRNIAAQNNANTMGMIGTGLGVAATFL